ncbi:50S ribosomal protein L4 [candidate division KSB1 bacterium]|nr:50S ribosomal protein L4 [candidate division KSB1 bacterium]
MELSVHKADGTPGSETVALNDEVFGVKAKPHLVHLAILSYQAAKRQGTHLARNRSMVKGSGKKPYRQKGTGRARAGTVKSNIWRSGGKSFGPKPHSYNVGINKKEKKLARRSALSYKASNKAIVLIEDFVFDKPETRQVADILRKLNIENSKRTMLVIKDHSSNLWQSCRNIKNLGLRPAAQLSTYDIVRQERLVIQKSALEHMNEVF